jgi:hypothetical protein
MGARIARNSSAEPLNSIGTAPVSTAIRALVNLVALLVLSWRLIPPSSKHLGGFDA